jgi:hypothetical protein
VDRSTAGPGECAPPYERIPIYTKFLTLPGTLLPIDLYRRVKARATLRGEDVSDMVARALRELMEREPAEL